MTDSKAKKNGGTVPSLPPGLFLSGMINCKNVYNGKDKAFHSVDVSVLGSNHMFKVDVTEEFYNQCAEGEMFSHQLKATATKFGTRFEIK